MIPYTVRRICLIAVTLLIVSMIVFAVAELLPGDVGRVILGQYATEEQVTQVDRELGADRPILVRYVDWAGKFLKGDWGRSFLLNTDIKTLILERLRNSLFLASFAFILVIPFSVFFGVIAALNHGRWIDKSLMIGGLSMIALPEFVAGVFVLYVFAVKLKWFPAISQVPEPNPSDWLRQFFLPSVPVMLVLFGYVSRLSRNGVVTVLRSNYVRTAILKGLPWTKVVCRHVLRNALLPTVGAAGVQFGYLVGSLVVIERLFSYPGLGQLTLNAAIGHDLPVLEAAVLAIAVVFIISNLVADLLYALLNPRVRITG